MCWLIWTGWSRIRRAWKDFLLQSISDKFSSKILTISFASVFVLNSGWVMIAWTPRSWYCNRSFVVWVSHSPARIFKFPAVKLKTQWAPVKTTEGWINEPPQRQSACPLSKAIVHGNSPKPDSPFTLPASAKSIPLTFLIPHPVCWRASGGGVGGWMTSFVSRLGVQQTSSTSWHDSGLNL